MTHICVSKLTIIGSDNGLSPGRRQAIIWTNAEILLIGHLGKNFSGILIEIHTFSFKENAFENVVWKTAAILSRPQCVNSLAPGQLGRNFRQVILQLILVIYGWSISCEIALRSMPLDLTDDESTSVQVMAWCHQATNHYLGQCWPRPPSPYGVTTPQWFNALRP